MRRVFRMNFCKNIMALFFLATIFISHNSWCSNENYPYFRRRSARETTPTDFFCQDKNNFPNMPRWNKRKGKKNKKDHSNNIDENKDFSDVGRLQKVIDFLNSNSFSSFNEKTNEKLTTKEDNLDGNSDE